MSSRSALGTFQSNFSNSPRHEFIGKPFDFRNQQTIHELETRINLPVYFLKQVHGDQIIDLRSTKWNESLEADGFLAERNNLSPCAIGVFTADCLPILIWSRKLVAALHAGWRGVAKGIVEKAVSHFDHNEKINMVIGPCAGGNSYEVGSEVIDQIGESAIYKRNGSRIFLDLAETAMDKVKHILNVETEILGECTMTNIMFHSHRRDGDKRGSNFSWISTEIS